MAPAKSCRAGPGLRCANQRNERPRVPWSSLREHRLSSAAVGGRRRSTDGVCHEAWDLYRMRQPMAENRHRRLFTLVLAHRSRCGGQMGIPAPSILYTRFPFDKRAKRRFAFRPSRRARSNRPSLPRARRHGRRVQIPAERARMLSRGHHPLGELAGAQPIATDAAQRPTGGRCAVVRIRTALARFGRGHQEINRTPADP
jgi:hypothetical protein